MKELMGLIEQSLRSCFRDKIHVLSTVNTIFFIVLLSFSFCTTAKLDRIQRKIDHRYFNITRSLEDIHDVEIDTYKGRVEKRK